MTTALLGVRTLMGRRGMLAGIYPIVPTPFDEKGAIGVESIGTMAEFMVRCGVTGLAILGVMTLRQLDRIVEHLAARGYLEAAGTRR